MPLLAKKHEFVGRALGEIDGAFGAIRFLFQRFHLEIVILLIVGALMLAKGINQAPLIDWDEATYAQVAHEAVANHSYLDFTWDDQPYLKKPPLLFWAVVASFKTFGESESAARLPSVIMGVGTLLLLYLMTAELFGRFAGFFAGILPLGFYFFVARGGRECATDAPLIFFSTLAIYALGRARTDRRWSLAVGAACGLAVLSKGVAGAIPFAVAAISMAVIPGFSAISFGGLIGLVVSATVVAAPWFVYQVMHNGSKFWTTYVKQETLMRVATHLEDNPRAAGFTWVTFLSDVRHLWPLLLPLVALVIVVARGRDLRAFLRIPSPVLVWILWFAIAFAAACAVQTKLGWYVLPALIPFALTAASVLSGALNQTGSAAQYCRPLAIVALGLLVLTAVPNENRIETAFDIQRGQSLPSYQMAMRADALAAIRGSGELYFAGLPLPTMVYYSGMPCHFVSASEPDFELTDLGGNPVSVAFHELAMKDAEGTVTAIDSFDEEWAQSAPEFERGTALPTNVSDDEQKEGSPSPE